MGHIAPGWDYYTANTDGESEAYLLKMQTESPHRR